MCVHWIIEYANTSCTCTYQTIHKLFPPGLSGLSPPQFNRLCVGGSLIAWFQAFPHLQNLLWWKWSNRPSTSFPTAEIPSISDKFGMVYPCLRSLSILYIITMLNHLYMTINHTSNVLWSLCIHRYNPWALASPPLLAPSSSSATLDAWASSWGDLSSMVCDIFPELAIFFNTVLWGRGGPVTGRPAIIIYRLLMGETNPSINQPTTGKRTSMIFPPVGFFHMSSCRRSPTNQPQIAQRSPSASHT